MSSSNADARPKGTVTTDRDRETTGPERERVTYRETAAIVEDLEALVDAGVFPNRSEAIRTATRQLVDDYTAESRSGDDGQ